MLVTIFNRVNEYPTFEGKNYKLHSLIHWKVLVIILSKLNPDQQQWLKCFEVYKSTTGLPLGPLGVKHSGPIPIADSHFHMDTLMARTGCSGFHELSCLTFMVANYCFPLSWPSSTQRTELRKTPSVHFSFSIHPRIVNSSNLQQYLTDLEYLIKSSRTVAVGECGLDNTAKSLQLDKQIKKNQRSYQLSYTVAEMNHSTVLLSSLTNCCPVQPYIHWHSFTSTQEIYQSAANHFTNLVFGVTPFIFSTRYPNIRGFIKKNGINRLVLKTESPYINYKENKIPNPYVINFIAEKISKLLNIPIEQIFSATFSNTQKVYGKRD